MAFGFLTSSLHTCTPLKPSASSRHLPALNHVRHVRHVHLPFGRLTCTLSADQLHNADFLKSQLAEISTFHAYCPIKCISCYCPSAHEMAKRRWRSEFEAKKEKRTNCHNFLHSPFFVAFCCAHKHASWLSAKWGVGNEKKNKKFCYCCASLLFACVVKRRSANSVATIYTFIYLLIWFIFYFHFYLKFTCWVCLIGIFGFWFAKKLCNYTLGYTSVYMWACTHTSMNFVRVLFESV